MGNNLKIMMMGASGTGKTCYMLAMYAAMSASLRGFTFSTQDLDDDLELTNRYEEMVHGEWPAPTADSRDWVFDCNYGFRKIMGFEWLDYRGGVLREAGTNEDVQFFRQKVLEASCVILCVAGNELADYVDGGSEPKGIKQFNAQMTRLRMDQKNTVPVVIAITKADQCQGKIELGVEMLRDGLLSGLFAEGGGWLVMFCPVSLGNDLASADGADCRGRIKPVNVHIPVTYAIYTRLEADIAEKEHTLRDLAANQSQLQQEMDRLEGAFFNGFLRDGDVRATKIQSEAIQKELNLAEKDVEQFQENMNRIKKELLGNNIFIYRDGRRVIPATRTRA